GEHGRVGHGGLLRHGGEDRAATCRVFGLAVGDLGLHRNGPPVNGWVVTCGTPQRRNHHPSHPGDTCWWLTRFDDTRREGKRQPMPPDGAIAGAEGRRASSAK